MDDDSATPNPAQLQDHTRQALRKNFLFSTLSDGEIAALELELALEQYAEGTPVVREGDLADALYLVVDGAVNVVKRNGQFLAVLGAGGFFGEMGLFSEGSLRTADCVAARPTTCAVLRKAALHHFCDAQPATGVKIYRAIIRTLSERLQATSADLAMLMGTRVKSQRDVSDIVARAKAERSEGGRS